MKTERMGFEQCINLINTFATMENEQRLIAASILAVGSEIVSSFNHLELRLTELVEVIEINNKRYGAGK